MTFVLHVKIEWHCRKDSCDKQQLHDNNEILVTFQNSVSHLWVTSFPSIFFSSSYFFYFQNFLIHHSLFLRATLCFEFRTHINFVIFKTFLCHFLLQTRVNWFIGKTRVISFLVLCFFKNVFLLCLILYFFFLTFNVFLSMQRFFFHLCELN